MRLLKLALAWLIALLIWRPGRRARALARIADAKRILLVRLDDHLGEALLMSPLVEALAGRRVELLVHTHSVRVLEGLPGVAKVWPFDDYRHWMMRWAPGIKQMHKEQFDVVIDCGNWSEPSIIPLLTSRLIAGEGALIGPRVGPGWALMDLPVKAREDTVSELLQRLHLLTPLDITGEWRPLRFREPRRLESIGPLLAKMKQSAWVVVNPGGRFARQRVPPEVFAGICRALIRSGRSPLVTWGPGEKPLAEAVVTGAPGAELAPETNLDELAALMRAAGLTICNNTGPMHLSVAMKVPTVALFAGMPTERWGHPYAPHKMIDLTFDGGKVDKMIVRAVEAIG